jgi:hypothetical protein
MSTNAQIQISFLFRRPKRIEASRICRAISKLRGVCQHMLLTGHRCYTIYLLMKAAKLYYIARVIQVGALDLALHFNPKAYGARTAVAPIWRN